MSIFMHVEVKQITCNISLKKEHRKRTWLKIYWKKCTGCGVKCKLVQQKGTANSSLADLNLASKAVVAFLDFIKAYDTVLRPFLYKVLEAKGVGEDFIHWVMLLLSETCTSARVNGYISKPVGYEAGLRQGCPLAPILYLFVAEALLCWLKECPSLWESPSPPTTLYTDCNLQMTHGLSSAI